MRIQFIFLILLVSCTFLSNIPTSQQGAYELYFCPANCQEPLEQILQNTPNQHCAFYDLDSILYSYINEDTLLLFEENYQNFGTPIKSTNGGLMHHKFCILQDDIVMTGSMNPTQNGMTKNSNVLFFIQGEAIAKNYETEYNYLQGKKHKTPNLLINHTFQNHSFLIENYFCPRDNCEQHVLETLQTANQTVRFLLFSFTSDAIAQQLIALHENNIQVQGMLEPSQFNKYSEETTLKQAGIDTIVYQQEGKLHQKTFIIDDNIVIFGSYNPTANGNTKNNENLLIIHDEQITKQFIEEFDRLVSMNS